MADYFASIFGTEKDKVNCSFYFKIGACRHGDRCSRVHNKPTFSQTVLIQNLYVNPKNSAKGDGREVTDEEDQRHFDEFFEDIFVELDEKYGPIEEMNVCDNLGDHLIGNVYVKFRYEEDAEKAVEELNDRWFGGKPVYAELSTVTDFKEAGCRQYEIGACTRGGFCNFMHLKQISDSVKRYLFGSSGSGKGGSSHRSGHRSHRSHISRSRSPDSRSRSRSRSSSRHRGHHHRNKSSSHRSSRRNRSRTRSKSLTPLSARSPSRSRSRSAPSPPAERRASRSRSRSLTPISKDTKRSSSLSRSRRDRRSHKSSSSSSSRRHHHR